jgi:hypothetical protein
LVIYIALYTIIDNLTDQQKATSEAAEIATPPSPDNQAELEKSRQKIAELEAALVNKTQVNDELRQTLEAKVRI